MRLSHLIGLHVRTESGHSLGHVHDVRGVLEPGRLRISGLVVGELGLLERLGLGAPSDARRLRTQDVIPWSRIVRADARGVIVRDGERRQ